MTGYSIGAPTIKSTNKTATHSNYGTVEFQNEGTVKRMERPQRGVSTHSFCSTLSQAQRFVSGVKQTNLSKDQEEQARTSLQEGFAYIKALTKLEIPLQDLGGTIYGEQSTAGVRQGQGPSPKRPFKRCQRWKHHREISTAHVGMDGTWTQSIAKVSVTEDAHEHHIATTQTQADL